MAFAESSFRWLLRLRFGERFLGRRAEGSTGVSVPVHLEECRPHGDIPVVLPLLQCKALKTGTAAEHVTFALDNLDHVLATCYVVIVACALLGHIILVFFNGCRMMGPA